MEGKNERLANILNSMEAAMPESVIPVSSKMAQLQIGTLEKAAGFPEKLKERLDKLTASSHNSFNDNLIYGSYYMRELQDYKTASTILGQLVADRPNSGKAVGLLVTAYEMDDNYEPAIDVLREWLVNYPDDKNARLRMREIQAKKNTTGNVDSKDKR